MNPNKYIWYGDHMNYNVDTASNKYWLLQNLIIYIYIYVYNACGKNGVVDDLSVSILVSTWEEANYRLWKLSHVHYNNAIRQLRNRKQILRS